jgi:hypothetical protein
MSDESDDGSVTRRKPVKLNRRCQAAGQTSGNLCFLAVQRLAAFFETLAGNLIVFVECPAAAARLPVEKQAIQI